MQEPDGNDRCPKCGADARVVGFHAAAVQAYLPTPMGYVKAAVAVRGRATCAMCGAGLDKTVEQLAGRAA